MSKSFRVKLIRSQIGLTQRQKDTVRCIGLRKIGSQVVVKDSPAMRGLIHKVQHLLDVQVEG
ncbi:MAG: 50S ribosomal protein L30 [Bdellovibrionales bacterium]|nr:50S ribosomal protein L30 [Bdellovibrionales bacterium]